MDLSKDVKAGRLNPMCLLSEIKNSFMIIHVLLILMASCVLPTFAKECKNELSLDPVGNICITVGTKCYEVNPSDVEVTTNCFGILESPKSETSTYAYCSLNNTYVFFEKDTTVDVDSSMLVYELWKNSGNLLWRKELFNDAYQILGVSESGSACLYQDTGSKLIFYTLRNGVLEKKLETHSVGRSNVYFYDVINDCMVVQEKDSTAIRIWYLKTGQEKVYRCLSGERLITLTNDGDLLLLDKNRWTYSLKTFEKTIFKDRFKNCRYICSYKEGLFFKDANKENVYYIWGKAGKEKEILLKRSVVGDSGVFLDDSGKDVFYFTGVKRSNGRFVLGLYSGEEECEWELDSKYENLSYLLKSNGRIFLIGNPSRVYCVRKQ